MAVRLTMTLTGVLATLAAAAPVSAAPSIDATVERARGALIVDVDGHDQTRRRVHLAVLATRMSSCPARPTAAARRASANPSRGGSWSRTLTLRVGQPGMAAGVGRHLRKVLDKGSVCVWQLRHRRLDSRVLAAVTANAGGIDWQTPATLVVACAVIVLLGGLYRRRRRPRRSSSQTNCAQVAAAYGVQPTSATSQAHLADEVPSHHEAARMVAGPAVGEHAAPVAREELQPGRTAPTIGTDGTIAWDGAPPAPDTTGLTLYQDLELGDPRLN